MYLGVFRYMHFLVCCLDILSCFVQTYQLIASEQAYSTQSGHKELPGFQRVLCHPFTIMPCKGEPSGPGFWRPPGARDFRLSLDTVWFFRVLFLFSFETETDTEIKRHECAFVSLLWEYDEGRTGKNNLLSLLNTSKYT